MAKVWVITAEFPKAKVYLRGERRGPRWTEDPTEAWQFARERDALTGARLRLPRTAGTQAEEIDPENPPKRKRARAKQGAAGSGAGGAGGDLLGSGDGPAANPDGGNGGDEPPNPDGEGETPPAA